MLRLRCVAYVCSLLLIVLPAVLLQAQGNTTTLAYGQRVTGQLSDQAPNDLYAFAAQQGDMIAVTMNALDGTLDPFIILLDGAPRALMAFPEDLAEKATRSLRNLGVQVKCGAMAV